MNPTSLHLIIATSALLGISAARAATVSQTDPLDGGIGYRWTVGLDDDDSATVIRRVGAWAWEDKTLFGNPGQGTTPVGWTHNSEWIALILDSPAVLTVRLENRGDVVDPSPTGTGFYGNNLFPGFTLYSGWDNDDPEVSHSYINRGNISWAEDLTYLINPEPNGTHVLEQTVVLPAGNYTMVLGGNSLSIAAEGLQGYQATFTTTPAPEPGSASLALAGCLALLTGRRRGVQGARTKRI